MKKESATRFWRRYFGLACNGSSSISVTNPALDFTVKAKSGEYDSISDQEYMELLKDCEQLLDGDTIEFGTEDNNRPAFAVDCSRVSVVLLGAFENLMQNKSNDTGGIGFGAATRTQCDYTNAEISYNDLISSGMRREIAGRINRIVPLHPLSASDYRALLTGPIIGDLEAAGQCKIEIDDHSADILSEQASKTELGARWMRSQIMNVLDDLMFDNPSAHVYTVNYPAAD